MGFVPFICLPSTSCHLSVLFALLCLSAVFCSSLLFSSCLSLVSLSPCSCLHPSPLLAVLPSFLLHYLSLIHFPSVCVCDRSPIYRLCVTAAVIDWTPRLLFVSSACSVLVERVSPWCCLSSRVASVPAVRVGTGTLKPHRHLKLKQQYSSGKYTAA